ncbi:hypothetical protein E2C01_062392 [Portunus trituberculatus]|uniref:Uncharacterized protein n=1 Tax=Portunus trituberculatus TaxID=210409 RepID=A0A5B7HEZ9_PORTR|nr:hypothetical protein [Portunus trituberculatus]
MVGRRAVHLPTETLTSDTIEHLRRSPVQWGAPGEGHLGAAPVSCYLVKTLVEELNGFSPVKKGK